MYTEAITVNAPEQQGNIQTYMYVANFLMEEGSNWENERETIIYYYCLFMRLYRTLGGRRWRSRLRKQRPAPDSDQREK